MRADYQQQQEQDEFEQEYPPPFSDEWYARMIEAQNELKEIIGRSSWQSQEL